MANDKSGILTPSEQERLEKSYEYRKLMVEEAFKNGVPTDSRNVEVINGVLNSMDKAIYDTANVRLKQQENMTKEATLEIVTAALREVHIAKQASVKTDRVIDVDDKVIPQDVVEGEMDLTPATVTLNDILNTGEK